MKALIVFVIIATIAAIVGQYLKQKDLKKFLVAIASLVLLISFAILGAITRPIIPLFLVHIVLVVGAWFGLVVYLIRDRYYWWLIVSPVITIVLFLILEFVTGSRNEGEGFFSDLLGSLFFLGNQFA